MMQWQVSRRNEEILADGLAAGKGSVHQTACKAFCTALGARSMTRR